MAMHAQSELAYFLTFLAQQTRLGIFVYRLDINQLVYINPAVEQIWQQSTEQVMREPVSLLSTIHREDQAYVKQMYAHLLEGKEALDVEFRIQLPDKSVRWICISNYVMKEESRLSAIAGYVEDITSQREQEDNVRKFSAKKNALLEILSHDLSAPVATIQGLAALLGKRLQDSDREDLQELVGLLEETARRNVHLIRSFVDQEALDTSQAVLVKERIDIVKKTAYIVEQLKVAEDNLNKTFHLVTSHPHIYLEVDEVKFIQVISNLLSNAIKFTPDNGTITTRIQEAADSIVISITDTGVGIPAHLQPVLFEPFTKAKRPGLRGEESRGLGMAIIKKIVELHGGKIWLESEENKGTTFWVEFPKHN